MCIISGLDLMWTCSEASASLEHVSNSNDSTRSGLVKYPIQEHKCEKASQ